MKLEFRVPVSPAARFYSQVRLLAQSLARLGGVYAAAKIQVSIGEQPDALAVAIGGVFRNLNRRIEGRAEQRSARTCDNGRVSCIYRDGHQLSLR